MLSRRLFQIASVSQAFSMIVSVLNNPPGTQPKSTHATDVTVPASAPSAPRVFRLRAILPIVTTLFIAAGIVLAVLGVLADQPKNPPRFQLGWLFPAIGVLAILELSQAELWRRLLQSLGGRLDVRRGLAVWCVSALARYVPTSMLTPVVRVRMSRQVPSEICIASVIYEAVLVNCGAACVAAYFVVTLPALGGNPWRWAVLVLPVGAISALHPSVFR
jgi:hypothetical protein